MGGLATLNFQLLNSGHENHVTSGPTVDGNTHSVVTIKYILVGGVACLNSQCTGGRLVSSRLRLVVLLFFTIKNASDLPSFCNELSVSVSK